MGIFSSTQPSLRVRVLPRFPANVIAGSGMTITKSGGTYTFSSIPADLPLSSLVDVPTDTLLGRDTAGTGAVEVLTVSNGLGMNGAQQLGLTNNQRLRVIPFIIQGGTSNAPATITTGIKGDLMIPFACTIQQVTLLADPAGAIQLDIARDTYANYPPTFPTDSMVGANPPVITATNNKSQNNVAGWTANINAGDILRFTVTSVTTIQRCLVSMDVLTL